MLVVCFSCIISYHSITTGKEAWLLNVLTCKDKKSELQNCFEWCITMSYLPLDFPYWTAFSSKWLYCGILEAAKSRDGFVVASVGLYCEIARIKKTLTVTRWSFLQQQKNVPVLLSKSPESATTVVNFFNCSNVLAMIYGEEITAKIHCKVSFRVPR